MTLPLEYIVSWFKLRVTDRGAGLVEYALLLALIAVVCIAAVSALGISLRDNYDENNTSIFGAPN